MWRKNRGLWTVYFGGGATSARGKLKKHLLSWMGDSQEITVYGTRIKRLHNEQSNSLSFIAFSVQFLFCKYPFLECPHQKRFYWSKKFVAKHFVDITIYLSEANDLSPWVPETFLARFPVFSRGFGQHWKFPLHARKTSGTQGNDLFNKKLGIVNWGFFPTLPDNFWTGTKTILDRASVHTQERWFRRDVCNGAKLCSADLESGASHIG